MRLALEEAKKAQDHDEVPIGAVLVDKGGNILAQNGNRTRELNDPTAHAEVLCIREACENKGAQRIPETTLYVTLEPCTMCAAAISYARIEKIVFAASDKKGGGLLSGAKFYDQSTCHHRPKLQEGLMKDNASEILRTFFKSKRKKPKI